VGCGTHDVRISGPPTYGRFTVPYGRLFELDVGAGSGRRVTSAMTCRRALPELRRRVAAALDGENPDVQTENVER